MTISFVKMHGLGNDFVVIDDRQGQIDFRRHAAFIADRHFGIGCDQILVLRHGTAVEHRMAIYNSDGSEAEMCGNGIRAFAQYLWTRGLAAHGDLPIETAAGVITVTADGPNDIRVNMGVPTLGLDAIGAAHARFSATQKQAGADIRVGAWPYAKAEAAFAVSLGNPHLVIFTVAGENVALAETGPALERDPAFPARVNVEFVAPLGPQTFDVRVWERGAGATLACGTGAAAAGAAIVASGRASGPLTIRLPGGDLVVEWDGRGPLWLIGPATETYFGRLNLAASEAWRRAHYV